MLPCAFTQNPVALASQLKSVVSFITNKQKITANYERDPICPQQEHKQNTTTYLFSKKALVKLLKK
jgi:hypothetical protein